MKIIFDDKLYQDIVNKKIEIDINTLLNITRLIDMAIKQGAFKDSNEYFIVKSIYAHLDNIITTVGTDVILSKNKQNSDI